MIKDKARQRTDARIATAGRLPNELSAEQYEVIYREELDEIKNSLKLGALQGALGVALASLVSICGFEPMLGRVIAWSAIAVWLRSIGVRRLGSARWSLRNNHRPHLVRTRRISRSCRSRTNKPTRHALICIEMGTNRCCFARRLFRGSAKETSKSQFNQPDHSVAAATSQFTTTRRR